MALNLSLRVRLGENDRWLRSIAGTWSFRPVAHEGTFTNGAEETLREGSFQVRSEPTDGVWSWRVKLAEDPGGQGWCMQSSLDSPASTQPGRDSGARAATSKLRAVDTPRHRQMMAALRRELESRYGRAEKIHVRFREIRSQSVPWRLPRSGPWWSRVWSSCSGFYGKSLEAEA